MGLVRRERLVPESFNVAVCDCCMVEGPLARYETVTVSVHQSGTYRIPRGWGVIAAIELPVEASEPIFCGDCLAQAKASVFRKGALAKSATAAPEPKPDPYARARNLEQAMLKNYEVD